MIYNQTKKLAALVLTAAALFFIIITSAQVNAAAKKKIWALDCYFTRWDYHKCIYNKNGLLKKETIESNLTMEAEVFWSAAYTYKGKKISKMAVEGEDFKTEYSYSYDQDGRLAEASFEDDGDISSIKYLWENGYCVKEHLSTLPLPFTYSYDKNGWITRYDNTDHTEIYKYDRNGYTVLSELEGDPESAMEYEIRYDSDGQLNVVHGPDHTTYIYEQIKVPASSVKQIKRQQAWLSNKGNAGLLPLAAY